MGGAQQDLKIEQTKTSNRSILIAVPARDDKKIEVYQFPQEKLFAVVPRVDSKDTGEISLAEVV